MMGRLIGGLLGLVGLVALLAVGAYFALKRPDIPYETLAARYETSASRYVDLPGGVRMHYRDEGLQTPGAQTLLLIHGFSASLQTWELWQPHMRDQFRLVSLDLPGHGLTSAPAGYQASIEGYRDLVAEFARTQGLERFAIVGSSMGGNVAWEYALAHPEQVEALVLVDASGWPDERAEANDEALIFKLLRNPIAAPLLRDLDNTQLTRQGLLSAFPERTDLVDDAMVARYVDMSRAPGHREILVQLSLDFNGRAMATTERLGQLAMPTLVLSGDMDNLVPVAHARQFHEAIPQSQLIVYEGIGHVPQEEIPEESAQNVRTFLLAQRANVAATATP
ncbi:hydrolase, alpha/beta hydrolase fold family [alpha proteobacterium U9-1i]|nr:hydrolase, alpha/beta hydrolase fold family [alpha proteobacterium U9-1i]